MQIGYGKQGIVIGEYGMYQAESPKEDSNGENLGGIISDGCGEDKNRVIGWIEPACNETSWIIWFTQQGDLLIYTKRNPGGAVIGQPIKIKAVTETKA